MLTPHWAKSRYSNPSGSCVEARLPDGSVQVRDTKDPGSPVLKFSPAAWMEFIDRIRLDELPGR